MANMRGKHKGRRKPRDPNRDPSMSGPKRSPSEREEDISRIIELERRGYSLRDIKEQLDIERPYTLSREMIRIDLQEGIRRFRQEVIDILSKKAETEEEERNIKKKQYEQIRREAWKAWERSKQDAASRTRSVEVMRGNPNSNFLSNRKRRHNEDDDFSNLTEQQIYKKINMTYVRHGRLPANEYLKTIALCLKAERELDGIDAPIKTEATVSFDFDRLSGVIREPIEDKVQAAIDRLRMQHDPDYGESVSKPEPGEYKKPKHQRSTHGRNTISIPPRKKLTSSNHNNGSGRSKSRHTNTEDDDDE